MDLTGWVIVIGSAVAITTFISLTTSAWSTRRFKRAVKRAADRPIDQAERDREFGSLTIQGNTLYYSHVGSPIWSLHLDETVLIAERTTATGPLAIDWFIVFFSGVPPDAYEAPVYANLEIHRLLSHALGVEIRPQLTNSTKLQTAIAWPHYLERAPFLNYVPAARGNTILSRLKDRLSPLVQGHLTDDVQELLSRGGGAAFYEGDAVKPPSSDDAGG